MPDILIRDLDPTLVERLKDRAAQNGRSLQAEVTAILQAQADLMTPGEVKESLAALRKRFAGRTFPDIVELIREGREER